MSSEAATLARTPASTDRLAEPWWQSFPAAALVFAALTIILTWPQAIHAGSVIAHRDSWFNLWRLAWIAHSLGRDPATLFDANIFAPERNTLAYSDAMLAEGVAGAPLLWLGLPTALAYNGLVLASFVFSALAAFACVRYLTGSWTAGMVAGVIFAFAPFRFDHYMHFELLWSGWMPLALIAMWRTVETGRIRWGIATGVLIALQTFSSIYYGIFLASVMASMTAIALARASLAAWWRSGVAFACGAAIAGALVLPYMQPYQRARAVVGERSEAEVQLLSAGPVHYLAATPDNWLYGRWADRLGRHEKRLFPGAIAAVLAALGMWPLDRRRITCLVGLFVAVNLSFGANGIGYHALREYTSVYRGLRAPARAGQVAILMIAVFAGLGWLRVRSWLASRSARRAQVGAVVTILAMGLEYATMPLPIVKVPAALPVSQWLAAQPVGIVAELPMPTLRTLPGHDGEFAFQSTFHWQSLVNGYSGNAPASYIQLVTELSGFPSTAGLVALRRAKVRYVVLHERWYDHAAYRAIVDFLDTQSGVVRRGTFGDGEFETVAYELTAEARRN